MVGGFYASQHWQMIFKTAQKDALAAIERIYFDGMQYRRDIGWRAIKR